MQGPLSQTERDRNAREGKGNSGPSSATLRWVETPRRRGGESDRNRPWIVCITPIHQVDSDLSLAVLQRCLTHTHPGRLTAVLRTRTYCDGDSSHLVAQLIMSPKLSVSYCRSRLRPFACPTPAGANASGKMTIAAMPATWAGPPSTGQDGIREKRPSACPTKLTEQTIPFQPYSI